MIGLERRSGFVAESLHVHILVEVATIVITEHRPCGIVLVGLLAEDRSGAGWGRQTATFVAERPICAKRVQSLVTSRTGWVRSAQYEQATRTRS